MLHVGGPGTNSSADTSPLRRHTGIWGVEVRHLLWHCDVFDNYLGQLEYAERVTYRRVGQQREEDY